MCSEYICVCAEYTYMYRCINIHIHIYSEYNRFCLRRQKFKFNKCILNGSTVDIASVWQLPEADRFFPLLSALERLTCASTEFCTLGLPCCFSQWQFLTRCGREGMEGVCFRVLSPWGCYGHVSEQKVTITLKAAWVTQRFHSGL